MYGSSHPAPDYSAGADYDGGPPVRIYLLFSAPTVFSMLRMKEKVRFSPTFEFSNSSAGALVRVYLLFVSLSGLAALSHLAAMISRSDSRCHDRLFDCERKPDV